MTTSDRPPNSSGLQVIQAQQDHLRSLSEEFQSLAGLKAGWYDGELGDPIEPGTISRLERFCRTVVGDGIPRPTLAPAIDFGELIAEWQTPTDVISVSLDSDTSQAEVFSSTRPELNRTINLDDERAVRQLIAQIVEIFELHGLRIQPPQY